MQFFLNELKTVLRGLRARKGRSALTILGIVIGVAGVITIISLGAGAQSLVLGQITKLGSNLLAIMPGKSNEDGPPAAAYGITITTLTREDAEALRDQTRFPHIMGVSGSVTGTATLLWRNLNVDTFFEAVEADSFSARNIEIASGEFINPTNINANVLVLGQDVKELLFGENDPIGELVKIKNIPFTVIGVAKPRGNVFFNNEDDKVYIPINIGQKQILGINYLQMIGIKVDAATNLESTITDIEQLLRERHNITNPEDDDFAVMNLADAVSLLTTITDALKMFLTLMAGIALLVGGIGIMNIMLVTVAERTREIGLRKAVGATNRSVRNQFLLEAGTLTFLGGIIGIIAGVVISYLVSLGARYAGLDWDFIISPISIILAVGVSILTGVLFGLYPAFKAAKLDPIEALRYE